MQCMIASGTAKLITLPVLYPTEVMRTQLQNDITTRYIANMLDFHVLIMKLEYCLCSYWQILIRQSKGKCFPFFYGGLSLQVPKLVLGTMVMFGTYELLVHCTHSILH